MSSSIRRQPKGVPVGGQFAANEHDEAQPLTGDSRDGLVQLRSDVQSGVRNPAWEAERAAVEDVFTAYEVAGKEAALRHAIAGAIFASSSADHREDREPSKRGYLRSIIAIQDGSIPDAYGTRLDDLDRRIADYPLPLVSTFTPDTFDPERENADFDAYIEEDLEGIDDPWITAGTLSARESFHAAVEKNDSQHDASHALLYEATSTQSFMLVASRKGRDNHAREAHSKLHALIHGAEQLSPSARARWTEASKMISEGYSVDRVQQWLDDNR